MAESSTSFRFPWHAFIIAILTVVLLWGFARGLNFSEVRQHLVDADMTWIVAAVVMTLVGFVLRARRWQALLAPLGHAHFRNTFRATIVGFTATNLLPGRLGEVLRPYLLGRAEGFQFSSTLATIIIERVLDLVCILLLFAWFLLTTDVDVARELKVAGVVGAVIAVAALAALMIGAGHPERLGRGAGRLAGILPGRAADAVAWFVRTLVEGLAVMRRPAPLVVAFAMSMLLWLSIAGAIWMTSLAFSLTMGPVDSFLVVGYLAVGVSIPTPGGMGGFDWFFLKAATGVFGIDPAQAGAAAIVLHAISFVPITLLGLLFMWQDGLTLRSMQRVKATVRTSQGEQA
jgi:uncharacterized protein (TIRG00374 family)